MNTATMDFTSLDDVKEWYRTYYGPDNCVLSLAGDVFLMLPEKWFVAGLGSFLLGHLAYIVGLQLAPRSWVWTAVGLVLVSIAIAVLSTIVSLTVPALAAAARSNPTWFSGRDGSGGAVKFHV